MFTYFRTEVLSKVKDCKIPDAAEKLAQSWIEQQIDYATKGTDEFQYPIINTFAKNKIKNTNGQIHQVLPKQIKKLYSRMRQIQ